MDALNKRLVRLQKAIFSVLVMILACSYAYGQDETMFLSESLQNRNDVIVRKGKWHEGFQTRITSVNDGRIYYVKFKKKGEKGKKINQTKVAYTLSFDEKFKNEKYPEQISVQEFLSLPVYNNYGRLMVFGTSAINVPQLEKVHPDITSNFQKGITQLNVASMMYSISYLLGGIPLITAGLIVQSSGGKRVNESFTDYYIKCYSSDVCAKYGIIITPYKTSHKF